MVDGLFFCATLTGHRGGHTPFVQAEVETGNDLMQKLMFISYYKLILHSQFNLFFA